MLHLHFSNRLEPLADRLLDHLAGESTGTVFAAPQVIVPSAAVQRWLTLEMARRHGVCANVGFDYLAHWLWRQIEAVVPGVARESPFDAPVMAWRIVAALGDAAFVRPHARLAGYVARADAVSRLELAQRIAALFDQYLTYRPDWLAAWSRGERLTLKGAEPAHRDDEAWQAALWRRIAQASGAAETHPAEAFIDALAHLSSAQVLAAGLPRTAHAFALPTMPPLHLRMLQALAQHIDVHVHALNPSAEYWFDVVDRKRLASLTARHGDAGHHETGHRLLAGWGRQAQSQLAGLVDAMDADALDDAQFEPAGGRTLLARLQDSILELADLAPGAAQDCAGDRSIELHVCHSLTRELEVLHDRLLALFAGGHGALEPGDVLVVTPDLDAAAPLIDAVFGTAPAERAIPYALTGRARSTVNPAARVLLDLLALVGSRWPASAVHGLLQQPMVARRFGLDGDDLEQVRRWLLDAGVHWAADAAHRASFGLPATPHHTLADGLDRLFLGHALPAQSDTSLDTPFHGRLPAGGAEVSAAFALGAFWCYADALGTLRAALAAPQLPSRWPGLLAEAMEAFIAPLDAELEDLREVHDAIDTLARQWQRSALAEPLGLDVLRHALQAALDDPARGGVPTGRVTFASMTSLRSLPFAVVCAIGLDDGAFPTPARPPEFDLMPLDPRRGDRQRRDDERNVFLDLLLAARQTLHLSHTGRSVRDNAPLPPSVLVAELLDELAPALSAAPHDAAAIKLARAGLIVEHPLQAFGEEAFRTDADPRLRSYHAEHAQALKRSVVALPASGAPRSAGDSADLGEDFDDETERGADEAALPFFTTPLPEPGAEWREVRLDQLVRFFRNPCRYLLEQRLGLLLRRDEDELDDDEPFVPGWRAQAALADRLWPALLAGADDVAVRALAEAGTELPAGGYGRHALEATLGELRAFARRVAAALAEPTVAPHGVALELELDGQRWRIDAAFADLRAGGLLRHRHGSLRAVDHLDAWLHHLMLCVDTPAGVAPVTTWLGRDGTLRLRRCDGPREVLATLLRLYAQGLREPLHFFPKAAWAYVDSGGELKVAAQVWRAGPHRPYAESTDVAYRLALRGIADPLDAAFEDCARQVFGPLFDGIDGDGS